MNPGTGVAKSTVVVAKIYPNGPEYLFNKKYYLQHGKAPLEMTFEFIKPVTELKPYITKIWWFEHAGGFTNRGTLIAPNARAKIIIPYKNRLTTTGSGKTAICKEGDICFIGIRDAPVTLGSSPGATGSIGIELTTAGAHRFLDVPMYHLANSLFSFSEVYGKEGQELLTKMADLEDPRQKIKLIQAFLLLRLQKSESNSIINCSVNFITSGLGLSPIKELVKKTGYSKRYLDMLFKEHLGISPKTLATITRFQHFYKSSGAVNVDNIYDLYYDQSHFIKEFKRYTGYTPLQFSRFNNDFGKHF
jgi:AraC-like DNA-binding protein